MPKADFASWDPKNLIKFCFEASQKISEQEVEIKALKDDLKTAIAAYRLQITKQIQKD